jgi:hypothetical protein
MPEGDPMRQIVRPAMAYLMVVFCAAFLFGTVRTLWLIPQIGEIAAVLVEVPLVLTLSWWVAGRVLRRWPLPGARARAALGALACAGLMVLELALGRFGFGRSLAAMLAAMVTPAGVIGLAGQVGFGIIPLLRQERG